jgi:hypothetical protein
LRDELVPLIGSFWFNDVIKFEGDSFNWFLLLRQSFEQLEL